MNKTSKISYLLLFILQVVWTQLNAQTDTLNTLQECRLRNGLPNFFAKLKSGKSVTIGYLGGSITAAKNGWREQSLSWLQNEYPKSNIKGINAGVGGTGSDLGVFRLKNDVLSYSPDLVFVEFAVNDGGLDPQRIHQTMEGIVRQIWKNDPFTDICFVYTLSGNMVPLISENKLWPSMLAMEHIAAYYHIPSVQFAPVVLDMLRSGKMIFQGKPEEHPGKIVFSLDNVHPIAETGHKLYTQALVRSLKKMQGNFKKLKHQSGKPFTQDNWEDAHMISVQQLHKTGDWRLLSNDDSVARSFAQRFPALYKATKPGAALQLDFTGRLAGLYDLVGPGCGQYEVTIDGGQSKLYARFNKYSNIYMSNYFCLPMMEKGKHHIEWKLSAKKPDKAALLKQGGKSGANEPKYLENSVYAGWLLLLGESPY